MGVVREVCGVGGCGEGGLGVGGCGEGGLGVGGCGEGGLRSAVI